MLGGVRIIEDHKMVDVIEDWSGVRAPSRAARRRRQGHRQNIKFIGTPKKEAIWIDGGRTMVMHPAMVDALRRELQARIDATAESVLLRVRETDVGLIEKLNAICPNNTGES